MERLRESQIIEWALKSDLVQTLACQLTSWVNLGKLLRTTFCPNCKMKMMIPLPTFLLGLSDNLTYECNGFSVTPGI